MKPASLTALRLHLPKPTRLTMQPLRKPPLFSTWADSFGSVVGLVCALHCALLPFVLALLPALGLGVLSSAGFEYAYVAFASVLALASLWLGYRRHRLYRALVFLVPGLVAVWSGVLVPAVHDDVIVHAVVMTFGGTLIAVAHLVNLRLNHGHVHDAGCSHGH
jgi:MerC mercury resistance protein